MVVSFDPTSELILVPAKLTGPLGTVMIRLLLDTGANITAIDESVLEQVGIDTKRPIETFEVYTASGAVTMRAVRLHAILSLGVLRRDFHVLCHNVPAASTAQGVLGLDFIRGHRLVLDMRKGQVRLH